MPKYMLIFHGGLSEGDNPKIRFFRKVDTAIESAYIWRVLLARRLRLNKKGEPMTTQTLTAVLHKEDDMYVAQCPEVGTVSQGSSIEEALANLKEATEVYLEEFPMPRIDKVLLTTFEAAVNA
jgi:predicted RNase H-like HicB family nuclease